MAEDKKSFILYADIINTVEELTDEEAGQLFKHVLRYVNDKNPVSENRIVAIAFEPIKGNLRRDLEKWNEKREKKAEAGRIGGLKSGEAKESKRKQIKAEQSNTLNLEANEAVNVNVNVNEDEEQSASQPPPPKDELKKIKPSEWLKRDRAILFEIKYKNQGLDLEKIDDELKKFDEHHIQSFFSGIDHCLNAWGIWCGKVRKKQHDSQQKSSTMNGSSSDQKVIYNAPVDDISKKF